MKNFIQRLAIDRADVAQVVLDPVAQTSMLPVIHRPQVVLELVSKPLYQRIDLFHFFLHLFLKFNDLLHPYFCLMHLLCSDLVAQAVDEGVRSFGYIENLLDG